MTNKSGDLGRCPDCLCSLCHAHDNGPICRSCHEQAKDTSKPTVLVLRMKR